MVRSPCNAGSWCGLAEWQPLSFWLAKVSVLNSSWQPFAGKVVMSELMIEYACFHSTSKKGHVPYTHQLMEGTVLSTEKSSKNRC